MPAAVMVSPSMDLYHRLLLASLAGSDLMVTSIPTHTELHRILERDPDNLCGWV